MIPSRALQASLSPRALVSKVVFLQQQTLLVPVAVTENHHHLLANELLLRDAQFQPFCLLQAARCFDHESSPQNTRLNRNTSPS